ncbi:Protein FAF1 [Escovopsis weberi]|uniref:Protein FAF1 n=1 Tax=Escovopsis weberi TaxID=150374 RepID=A0A0M8MVX7_ESCWE|nr:Protein FAF1 [Escovopsis weberi]
MSKRELKVFMSSRPPDSLADSKSKFTAGPRASSSSSALPEDAPSLLAQDLELRRLLAESHLFRPSRASSSSVSSAAAAAGAALEPRAFASGRIRQKTTDLRIQALGSKASILKQDKMPMHMRKGIHAAATARETKRRREAKENGIILERETAKNKPKGNRRSGLDVGRPGVGRMKGAELRISQSDVRRIEGARDTFGRKGRR